MTFGDAESFVWKLAAVGLTPYKDNAAEEAVIAATGKGFSKACSWLEVARHEGGVIVWLKGTAAGAIASSKVVGVSYRPTEDVEFVRREGAVDVYRDKASGQTLYVGRTQPQDEPPEPAQINDAYRKACGLMEGLICLGGAPLSGEQRQRLERSVPLFESVIAMSPAHWAAMWTLGKVLESLDGDLQRRFELFTRAYRVNPDQVDVAREAAAAAMLVGRDAEALGYCQRAVALDPQDPGLRTNLGLGLLLTGDVAAARTTLRDALREDPDNAITKHLAGIVDDVLAGGRPCPRHIRDLQ